MAVNTSQYVYVVGETIVTADREIEPWKVLVVCNTLDDAKAEVAKVAPDPVRSDDPKVNRYWITPLFLLAGSEPEEQKFIFWDIQKIKYVPAAQTAA
jgi:hypothetical protein